MMNHTKKLGSSSILIKLRADRPQPMISRLFVYGSLLSDFAPFKSVTKQLHSQVKLLGEGYLPGYLIDLGAYPGFIYHATSPLSIRGEILEADFSAALWYEIDQYEGDEYLRIERSIQFNQTELDCFLYEYQLPSHLYPSIPVGDYRKYVEQNSAHREFIGIRK